MRWIQDYKFPNLFDLFRTVILEEGFPKETEFPDKHIINLALHGLGWSIRIKKVEKIKMEGSFFPIYGLEVTLSNGEVYRTVMKERYIDKESGNYGEDRYKWEKVTRKKVKSNQNVVKQE